MRHPTYADCRHELCWCIVVCGYGDGLGAMPNIQSVKFICPNCGALYRLVRAEAGPKSGDREITCRSCGAPLQGRKGRFILKYFLIERANDKKQRHRHLTQRSPRLSRDRHINCDRLSLPAAGKRQSQEVVVVFEEETGGKSLASARIFERHHRAGTQTLP
jgi:predicted RNA-binding Zn-ribbon protein involved in translation (DUF1610 family)